MAETESRTRITQVGTVIVPVTDQDRALDIAPRVLRPVEVGVEEAFTSRPLRRERQECDA